MKQVGLAAQLALKEGGTAAGAAVAGAAGAGKAARPGAWSLPELDASFRLEPAMDQALSRAARHFNHALAGEGLVVRLPQSRGETAEAPAVQVAEKETNTVLRAYNVPDFLKFYATREKTNGVVVDGQV